jgi:ribokinase
VLWHDATVHEYPNPDVDVTDPSGRDDAFAGALVAALLDDEDPQDALRRAIAARALATTVPGAVPTVDPESVAELAEQVEKPRG